MIEVIRTEYTLGNTTITSFVPLDLTEYSDNLLLCDYTKDIGSIYVGKFVLFLGDD